MKHEKVLERVYNPGRLHAAWQQVKENAGAAGIDRMISHTKLLNYHCSVADRGAAYLAGTSRSVGRGWSLRPLPTRLF